MAEEKKTTTAKAPAKTVRRVRKTAQKAETTVKNVTGSIRNGGNKRSGSINRGSRYNVKGC